jgi:hypothetical protein
MLLALISLKLQGKIVTVISIVLGDTAFTCDPMLYRVITEEPFKVTV